MGELVPQPLLAPNQIVYLATDNSRLYAEVIEIVSDRQICWARPLVLVDLDKADGSLDPDEMEWGLGGDRWATPKVIYSLADGPDILWPLEHFHLALDTEILPILAWLHQEKKEAPDPNLPRQHLQRFIRQFWGQ